MRVPYLTGRYAKKHLAHHNALADAVNALSEGAAVPNLEDVLAQGSDAGSFDINNVGAISVGDITGVAENAHTAVGFRKSLTLQATTGQAAEEPGGDISLSAGFGNEGTTSGARIVAEGGQGDRPGYVVIVTGDSAGTAGQVLVSDGNGHAVWADPA